MDFETLMWFFVIYLNTMLNQTGKMEYWKNQESILLYLCFLPLLNCSVPLPKCLLTKWHIIVKTQREPSVNYLGFRTKIL